MRTRLAGPATALALLAACAGDARDAGVAGDGGDAAGAPGRRETTLTVLAAASLTGPFTALGASFEDDHRGVTVRFAFAGSSGLAAQVQQGAGADVFAAADTATMDGLVADGLVLGEPAGFASNTLQIATPPDNPARVDSLQDLAAADVRVVVCAPEVPCGAAAARVEAIAGADIRPVSEEPSVTDVLGKVTTGEADAGLVYVTDVIAAGDRVHGVPFPESADVVNVYPVATLAGTEHRSLAAAFVGLVTGAEGRQVLADAGFGPP